MELYGIKLHILNSITGGFILHRNDKWPNIIKTSTLILMFGCFYFLQAYDLSSTQIFVAALLVSIFVLIIELIVVWFNSLLDDSVNTSDAIDDNENSVIPAGISGPLWESRQILFNERLQMDDRAYQLVRKGFDVDEVFRMVQLVRDGTITRETRERAPIRRVRTNMIFLCGQSVNVHFDRESLQRTFARPVNNWHLLSSVILTFLLSVTTPLCRDMLPSSFYWLTSILCAIAIFSLLLPPTCDPYSTSFGDPYIAYSRAAVSVSLTGATAALNTLKKILPEKVVFAGYEFNIASIIYTGSWILYIGYLCYPVLFMIGIFGNPITTIHWLIESLNKYLFGICGEINMKKSMTNFLSSAIMVLIVSFILNLGNQSLTIGISVLFVTFFTQFSIADNCQTFMKKHLVTALVAATISGSTSLLNWLIAENAMPFIYTAIVICHAVIDFFFPYLTTHQTYLFFYGRVLNIKTLSKYAHYITNFVTAPAFISFSLNKNKITPILGAIIILHGLRIAQTMPHIFSFAIICSYFFFHFELGLESLSLSLLLSLLFCRKMIKVMRLFRLWSKCRYVPDIVYTDPLSHKWEYFKWALLTDLISTIPHPLGGLCGPAFAWSLCTGAPMSIFFGYIGLFSFSPPRPNSFYDFVNGDVPHDEYIKSSSDHPLEAPTYLSLSEALQDQLGRLVKDGQLGLVNDDSFFLMISDDLMAIIHIIALEANKVSFQVRGLEYISQTLCHGGELGALQQIVLEHQKFGNIGHAYAFRHSMFALRVLNIPLNMVSFSRASLAESVVPRLGKSFLMWELKSLVYFGLKGLKMGLTPEPEDPSVIEEKLRPIKGTFSERNMEFIRYVASELGITLDEITLKKLWIVTHFTHSVIVDRKGCFKYDQILDVFDGKGELKDPVTTISEVVLYAFRYSLAVLFLVSVGLEPENANTEAIYQFMQETEAEYTVLPLRSPELEGALHNGEKPVITMLMNGDSIEMVRFAKSITNWSVFELESESIRGFWVNEARSILFLALSSRERHSIQASIPTLRNITNQSCNMPVGYPAYVTSIIESYNDKE